jgi:hypothetical protein
MLVAPVFLLSVDRVFAAQYLNCPSEPVFNSGDSTVLMCDDFEADGKWYVAKGAGSRNVAGNDGWEGEFFAPLDPQGYGRCGSLGAVGTTCTATTGQRTGARAEGMHWFGPAENRYDEIYHRFYTKFLPGYVFGHEKLVFYQHDESTNGQVGLLQTPFAQNTFDFATQPPDSKRYPQNQGNDLRFTPGKWYYIEVHIKLDAPKGSGTGIIQVWADDCGTSGLGCTGPGTLRLSYSGLNIRPSASLGLGVIWQENWGANANGTWVSVGEVYNDQVIVRKQRIGPMGVIQPPFNLKVQ